MSRRAHFVVAVLCLWVLAPLVASAQQAEPTIYTFVAEWNVPRAQWDEFTATWEKNSKPILERMAANGTLISWGTFSTIVHQPDETTHGTWWAATSTAAIERVREELIKVPPSPAMTAATRHQDYFLRSLVHKAKTTAPSSGYVYVSSYVVKPGQGQQWRELWDKYTRPVLEDQIAKGNILYLAAEVEDVHTQDPGLRFVVTISPSADAMDKVDAAISAANDKRSAEERRAIGAAFADALVAGTHRDFFAKVVSWWHK